ncbi:transcriptional regulator family: Fungal Specific TF [Penicillium sp. IBT 35674x]|nr:transcriptional regulator family: Fungal Specific TF [Penicillium sp. IBT 35674x]
MRAYYIRAISLRARILKYVKSLEGEVPWESETSKFSLLNAELQSLEGSIPDTIKMTTANKYLYKSLGRLNLFFGLHILLAQTFNDLYRICVAQLVFPDTSTKWIRDNAPQAFTERCHWMCLKKGVYIAKLLKELWLFDKPSLIDTSYANHVQICSSVLLTTLLSWGEAVPLLPHIGLNDYEEMLRDNLAILQHLQKYIKVDAYCQSTREALRRFKKLLPVGDLSRTTQFSTGRVVNEQNVPYSQSSLDYILNPLGTYPLARKQTQEHDTFYSSVEVIMSESFAVMNEAQPPTANSNLGNFADFVSSSPFDWSETLIFDSAGYPTFLDELTGWNAQTLEWSELSSELRSE